MALTALLSLQNDLHHFIAAYHLLQHPCWSAHDSNTDPHRRVPTLRIPDPVRGRLRRRPATATRPLTAASNVAWKSFVYVTRPTTVTRTRPTTVVWRSLVRRITFPRRSSRVPRSSGTSCRRGRSSLSGLRLSQVSSFPLSRVGPLS